MSLEPFLWSPHGRGRPMWLVRCWRLCPLGLWRCCGGRRDFWNKALGYRGLVRGDGADGVQLLRFNLFARALIGASSHRSIC